MPEEVVNCLLCGGSRSEVFDQRKFRGYRVTNRLCQACGLVFQSPRMTQAEAEAFYAANYREIYQGAAAPTTKDLAVQKGRAASLLAFTRKHIKQVKRHLDIGSSAGQLLLGFQSVYRCQPAGIEPGDAYRQFTSQQGLAVYGSLDELLSQEEERFDLVSMAHVLEHLPDPVSYLLDLREKILQPEGWLLLETPNLYAHDSFEIAHTISFSSRTLEQVVRKAGFEIVALEKHGRPRSNVVAYYLSLLARPVPSANQGFEVQPERAVRLKRKAGLLYRLFWTRVAPGMAWRGIEAETG